MGTACELIIWDIWLSSGAEMLTFVILPPLTVIVACTTPKLSCTGLPVNVPDAPDVEVVCWVRPLVPLALLDLGGVEDVVVREADCPVCSRAFGGRSSRRGGCAGTRHRCVREHLHGGNDRDCGAGRHQEGGDYSMGYLFHTGFLSLRYEA